MLTAKEVAFQRGGDYLRGLDTFRAFAQEVARLAGSVPSLSVPPDQTGDRFELTFAGTRYEVSYWYYPYGEPKIPTAAIRLAVADEGAEKPSFFQENFYHLVADRQAPKDWEDVLCFLLVARHGMVE